MPSPTDGEMIRQTTKLALARPFGRFYPLRISLAPTLLYFMTLARYFVSLKLPVEGGLPHPNKNPKHRTEKNEWNPTKIGLANDLCS